MPPIRKAEPSPTSAPHVGAATNGNPRAGSKRASEPVEDEEDEEDEKGHVKKQVKKGGSGVAHELAAKGQTDMIGKMLSSVEDDMLLVQLVTEERTHPGGEAGTFWSRVLGRWQSDEERGSKIERTALDLKDRWCIITGTGNGKDLPADAMIVRGAGYIDQPWTPGDNTAQMKADADKLYEFAEGKGMAAPDVRGAGTQAGFSADLLRLLQGPTTSRSASDAGRTGAGAGAPSASSTSSASRGRGPDVPPAAPASAAAVAAEGRRGGSAAQAAGGKAGPVSAAVAVASLSTSSGPRFAPAASPSFEIGVQVIAAGGGSLGKMKLFSTTMDTPAQEKLQEIAHRVCVIDGTHVLKDAVAMYCPSYQMDPERHRNSSRHEWLIGRSLVPAITFDNLFSGIWSPSPQGRQIVLLIEPFYEGDKKSDESNMMLIKSASCTNFR